MNDQVIPIVRQVAIHLELIVRKVLTRVDRDSVGPVRHGVGKRRIDNLPLSAAVDEELHYPAQLSADTLEIQRANILEEALIGDLLQHWELCLDLGHGDHLLQTDRDSHKSFAIDLDPRALRERAHEAVHERIEAQRVHIRLLVAYEWGDLNLQLA